MTAQRLARTAARGAGCAASGRSLAGGRGAAAGPGCPLLAGRSSGGRGRSLIRLSSAPQADLVAVRIGEDGEPAVVTGQVRGRDQALATQLLGAVQVGVQVVDPHVDLHALLPRLGRRADAAADGPVPGAGIDQAVPAHGRIGGDLPAEQLAVELLRPLVIRANHLEERYWLAHGTAPSDLLSVMANVSYG